MCHPLRERACLMLLHVVVVAQAARGWGVPWAVTSSHLPCPPHKLVVRTFPDMYTTVFFFITCSPFSLFFFPFFLSFLVFLGPHPYMEVPRLGVQSEGQSPTYATATATWDPSHVRDRHHSSRYTPTRIVKPASSWI